ncbi:uncharacterized protein EKO05_0004960 [Ascochyta rabiei]|uniref:uncharacterized protein n=1 Tax=Didymella rabiei TaxID=5454 RepID=UPI0022004620|nr:uncharacterized protein EKO05_0004960 [Ascochyta rabiei]UPX14480.1 hypothetical protein EKO05_0004960 [Ascochyta rabiei]
MQPLLLERIQSLRDRDGHTYYNGSVLHRSHFIVVGIGNMPFNLFRKTRRTMLSISMPHCYPYQTHNTTAQTRTITAWRWRM